MAGSIALCLFDGCHPGCHFIKVRDHLFAFVAHNHHEVLGLNSCGRLNHVTQQATSRNLVENFWCC